MCIYIYICVYIYMYICKHIIHIICTSCNVYVFRCQCVLSICILYSKCIDEIFNYWILEPLIRLAGRITFWQQLKMVGSILSSQVCVFPPIDSIYESLSSRWQFLNGEKKKRICKVETSDLLYHHPKYKHVCIHNREH